MALIDLPIDILVLIFSYFGASDFLSLTSSCKALLTFRQEPSFWHGLTAATFRLPPQPLLRADGARWQWLYKSLATQSRVYTWGNNEKGNLGHSAHVIQNPPGRALRRGPAALRYQSAAVPSKIQNVTSVGIVSDVQCGWVMQVPVITSTMKADCNLLRGWSTVLLNPEGQLFIVGVLNAERFPYRATVDPTRLSFPAGYPPTTRDRYDPATAISRYSVGRSHVLGLSDSGKIWEWSNNNLKAKFVKFLSVDVMENHGQGTGSATRVAAGWAGSSAYISGCGIIFWNNMPGSGGDSETDGYLTQSKIVPETSYQRHQAQSREGPTLDNRIGEVINHIVLDHYIVFITHKNKVFVYPVDIDSLIAEPIELTTFSENSPDFHIEDIQGQMCNFGVFSSNGHVLLGNSDLLKAFIESSQSTIQRPLDDRHQPRILPALQKSSVISLAFGDYHFHALHSDGTISSHGTEPRGCGALGLASTNLASLRGAIPSNGDRRVSLPPWNRNGRRTVWFEQEKIMWLSHLSTNKGYENEAEQRLGLIRPVVEEACQVWGEWLEREGRAWHLGPRGTTTFTDKTFDADTENGAYFALKITAAGWHSGALVLVDEQKAERVRQKWLVQQKPGINKPQTYNDERSPLVQAVSGAGTWLYETGRLFLGLTERDALQTENKESLASRHLSYVWGNDVLPRLKLPSGQEMPGTAQLAEWKGGEPDFTGGQIDG
ncbi:hypothetical protein MMC17_007514 [Xylographa soralifera]|nr:hypothetical protein [Xylographa soralifera]